jgi:hypothetical protein
MLASKKIALKYNYSKYYCLLRSDDVYSGRNLDRRVTPINIFLNNANRKRRNPSVTRSTVGKLMKALDYI